jgi:hypothetical protein
MSESPLSLLSRMLGGDSSITNFDIQKATQEFFESHGVVCCSGENGSMETEIEAE